LLSPSLVCSIFGEQKRRHQQKFSFHSSAQRRTVNLADICHRSCTLFYSVHKSKLWARPVMRAPAV
jgi:hypothetical protein